MYVSLNVVMDCIMHVFMKREGLSKNTDTSMSKS